MAMVGSRARSSLLSITERTSRSLSTKSAAVTTHHQFHQQSHQFLESNSFIGSWDVPINPKEAEKRLAQLRRDYAKQVKAVRKEYIHEMEMLRLEKQRKNEARMQAVRAANEERRRLKAEAAKVRAQERMVAEEEFRKLLMKERAEKLESWRMKEKLRDESKKEKKEHVCRKSSMWIEEHELEARIFNATVDATSL